MIGNLTFYDLETTGLDMENDRIVELFARKYTTGEVLHLYFNPGKESSPEALEKHGLTTEFLSDKPTFEEKAPEIMEFFGDSDLAGYLIVGFDNYMLAESLERAGYDFKLSSRKCVDVKKLWDSAEPRTLSGAYKRFTGFEMIDAHKASCDVNATLRIFQRMPIAEIIYEQSMKDYGKIVTPAINTLDEISRVKGAIDHDGKLMYDDNKDIILKFGKHDGKKFKEIMETDLQYLEWAVSDKSQMSGSTKYFIKKILKNNGERI